MHPRISVTFGLLVTLVFLSASVASAQSAPPASGTPVAENMAATGAAKALYSELLVGKIDRSKMSPEINNALTDATAQTLAKQLTALGTPTWQYLQQVQVPGGTCFGL